MANCVASLEIPDLITAVNIIKQNPDRITIDDVLSQQFNVDNKCQHCQNIFWNTSIISVFNNYLFDENNLFDHQNAKKLNRIINKWTSVTLKESIPTNFFKNQDHKKEMIDLSLDIRRKFSPCCHFIAKYMHFLTLVPGIWKKPKNKLIIFKEYIIPYCAGNNVVALFSTWLTSKKHFKKYKKNLDFPYLTEMQNVLLNYIIRKTMFGIVVTVLIAELSFFTIDLMRDRNYEKSRTIMGKS